MTNQGAVGPGRITVMRVIDEKQEILCLSAITPVFGLMACGAREGECGCYRVRTIVAVVRTLAEAFYYTAKYTTDRA